MLSLSDVALLNVVGRLRPREIRNLGLTDSTHNLFIQDPITRYRLLKYWAVTDKSVLQLQEYIPNITLQQISLVADYYYPIVESLDIFNKDQLFTNALIAGYEWDDCLPYYTPIINNITSIYVYRRDLLSKIAKPIKSDKIGFLAWCIVNKQYTTDMLQMLYSPHITVNMFMDLLLSLHNNDKIIYAIETGVIDFIEFRTLYYSNNPDLLDNITEYPPELLDKLNINISDYLSGFDYENTMISLSLYNSKKYPSYDLLDDITSGNILELLHKANTYDRNIIVTTRSLPQDELQRIYWNTRLETIGQALLHIHPENSHYYLSLRDIEYQLEPYQYLLLQHWCYPDISIEQLKNDIAPRKAIYFAILAAYYVPGYQLYEWDTSVIFERAVSLNYDRLERYLQYTNDYEGINTVILCHVFGKYDLISLIPKKSSIVRFFIDIFTPDSVIVSIPVSGEVLNMIINHTYLTPVEKLDILSKISLPHNLLSGLRGYTDKPDTLQLAGNILNAVCDVEDIAQYSPIKKLTLDDIHIRTDIDVNASFPIGLLWTETTILQNLQETEQYSYTNNIIDLLTNITTEYPAITIQEMVNIGDYYGIMSTDVMKTKFVLGKDISRSRFGYIITKFPQALI